MLTTRLSLIFLGAVLVIAPAATNGRQSNQLTPDKPLSESALSPSPTPSPSPAGEMEKMPGMKMPGAEPEAGPQKEMPATAMEMGPLLVMNGDALSVKLGSSSTNTLPLGQIGSGTSWLPISSPEHMIHKGAGAWLLMFHYNLIVGVNSAAGPRGATKFESPNWFMGMALHQLGPGTLQLRGMVSAEPFTFPRGGSPLLFQTGESYRGQPLVDRQHPHDLFMELSATYTIPIGERATWFGYLGYPGEPALGPVAFMHRPSAAENPSAPLAHHLQDSTHISFGVFTTGLTYRWFKLEGSLFNGREPDEHRYNFEAHAWDSRSVRLSFAPNNNWSLQMSHGLLHNPEVLEPGTTSRTTASISYNKPISHGNWATSVIWGRNNERHLGKTATLNGYTAESTINFQDRNYLFTRLELVDKNQLLRPVDRLRLGLTSDNPSFRVGAFSFGAARDLWTTEKVTVAIGGELTLYSLPGILDAIYGDHPTSARLFLRFRPGLMSMRNDHSGMKP